MQNEVTDLQALYKSEASSLMRRCKSEVSVQTHLLHSCTVLIHDSAVLKWSKFLMNIRAPCNSEVSTLLKWSKYTPV